MPSLQQLLERGETTRICTAKGGCNRELPLVDGDGEPVFVIKRAGGKNKTDQVTRLCKECKSRLSKARYREDPEKVKRRAAEWKRNNRDRINERFRERYANDPGYRERRLTYQRAENMPAWRLEARRRRQREYMQRPEVKARRAGWLEQYRQILRQAGVSSLKQLREIESLKEKEQRARKRRDRSAEGEARRQRKRAEARQRALALKATLTQDEMEMLELVAPIPTPVVQLYLEPMIRRARQIMDPGLEQDGDKEKYLGIGVVAEQTGIPERRLYAIMKGGLGGTEPTLSVGIDVVDKLSTHEDWDLEQITEHAREWAALTGDPWPLGYRGMHSRLQALRNWSVDGQDDRLEQSTAA